MSVKDYYSHINFYQNDRETLKALLKAGNVDEIKARIAEQTGYDVEDFYLNYRGYTLRDLNSINNALNSICIEPKKVYTGYFNKEYVDYTGEKLQDKQLNVLCDNGIGVVYDYEYTLKVGDFEQQSYSLKPLLDEVNHILTSIEKENDISKLNKIYEELQYTTDRAGELAKTGELDLFKDFFTKNCFHRTIFQYTFDPDFDYSYSGLKTDISPEVFKHFGAKAGPIIEKVEERVASKINTLTSSQEQDVTATVDDSRQSFGFSAC